MRVSCGSRLATLLYGERLCSGLFQPEEERDLPHSLIWISGEISAVFRMEKFPLTA